MAVSKLKLVVFGQDVGEFLAFYFNDESYKGYEGEWVQPLYEGENIIDLKEFCTTASRFNVKVGVQDGERFVEIP